MVSQTTTSMGRTSTTGYSVSMLVLGVLALLLPLIAGVGIALLMGFILIMGRVAYASLAFTARGTGTFLWRLLIGFVFAIGGLNLLFNPAIGLISLTLIVAIVFFFEAVAELVSYFLFGAKEVQAGCS